MATAPTPSPTQLSDIEGAVGSYAAQRDKYRTYAKILHTYLTEDTELIPFIHFSKFREKDPDHLRHKLCRKCIKNPEDFHVTPQSVFTDVTDLCGVRIIHLYTGQLTLIHPIIIRILEEQQYTLLEPPTAHTWDIEYQRFFEGLGIRTITRESLYTSVHYVVEQNSKVRPRCELQVRTLAEELWGEASHTLDYPNPTASVACGEQLKVLARVTSAATRLTDALFRSHQEHRELQGNASKALPSMPVGAIRTEIEANLNAPKL